MKSCCYTSAFDLFNSSVWLFSLGFPIIIGILQLKTWYLMNTDANAWILWNPIVILKRFTCLTRAFDSFLFEFDFYLDYTTENLIFNEYGCKSVDFMKSCCYTSAFDLLNSSVWLFSLGFCVWLVKLERLTLFSCSLIFIWIFQLYNPDKNQTTREKLDCGPNEFEKHCCISTDQQTPSNNAQPL